MKADMEYSVVIPTLNEVENLRILLPQLLRPNCEVVICDNGSTDGTVRLVEDALPNFGVRLSKGTGTVTDAILRGFREARGNRIIVMDGDGSHDPQIVYKMVGALDESDIVVGSRYVRGGGSRDRLRNRIISRVYNLLTFFLAPGIKDRASGFWGVRKELTSTRIRNTTKPMLEFLVRASHNSVKEVSYTFMPRLNGQSKLGRDFVTILKELWSVFLLYMVKFRLLNYMVVGGICYIINLGVYYPLTLVYKEQVTFLNQVYYLPPFIASTLVAGTSHYFMNKYWTFGDRKEGSLGFLRFWAVLGPTVIFDMVIIFLLVQYFNLVPVIAASIAILSVFLVRYTIANKWIWGEE